MPRAPRPVESFSPYLLEVYKQAALAPVRIRFATREKATKYRQDLNALRTSLGKENHPLHTVAVRCTNMLRAGPPAGEMEGAPTAHWLVITAPAGADYEEELEAAGINPFGGKEES